MDAVPDAVRAGPVNLSAESSIEAAADRIFTAALDHFDANRGIFAQNETIESVHQMRVALRRLRAALGLFRAALTGPALTTAAGRAKTIASALGDARDGDVFLALLAAGPGVTQDAPDLAKLNEAARRRRDAGYLTARGILRDAATTIFIDDLRRHIADRDWIAAPGAGEPASARDFARNSLDRLHRRARRKSRDLATQTAEARHEARIALKKLRYAAEFFESLFGRQRAARDYVRTLAALQDTLGGFNDLAAANRQIDLLHANDGALALAAGFVRGWFARAAIESVEQAHKSEKILKALKPFW
jgi:triphosphatase